MREQEVIDFLKENVICECGSNDFKFLGGEPHPEGIKHIAECLECGDYEYVLDREDGEEVEREIEFRGKRIDNGEWVYGDLLQQKDTSYIVCESETDCPDGENTDLYAVNWFEVDPKTVGQYIGLIDRNEKGVYENDIAYCLSSLEMFVIEWDPVGASYLFHNVDDKKRTHGIDYYEFEDMNGSLGFVVQGNIYEHPYLLE